MKKLVLSIIALASYMVVNAQCSDIFISEYVEGTGNNKALGIFNPTPNAINLNNQYRLVRYQNGSSAAAGEANVVAWSDLGNHVINSGDEWVIVIDRLTPPVVTADGPIVDTALQMVADTFMCSDHAVKFAMFFNGNDALSIQKTLDGGATWSYIDIFGMMGDPAMVAGQSWSDVFPYDGSVGTWWTKDHTLIRKPTVMTGVTTNPSPEFIVTTQWDSLPVNTFTHLGTHTCNCPTAGINELTNSSNISVYPNPTTDNYFTVTSSKNIKDVEVYDLLGREILRKETGHNQHYNLGISHAFAKGIYTVKVSLEDGTVRTTKLVVQ